MVYWIIAKDNVLEEKLQKLASDSSDHNKFPQIVELWKFLCDPTF